jgi:hypothetical protein
VDDDFPAMPNPLSRVREDPKVSFAPVLLLEHKLAPRIATSLAMWSVTEAGLGRLLTVIMGAQARPSLAMFGALTSNAAKVATVKAAARSILPEKELEMFEAISPLLDRAAAQRHKFAHHIWGVSEDVPDALLLVDPMHSLGFTVDVNEHVFARLRDWSLEAETSVPKFPIDKVFVYRAADFDRYIKETATAGTLLHYLCLIVDPALGGERVHPLLEEEPEFQTALSRLRQARNKQAAKLQPPHEQSPPGDK